MVAELTILWPAHLVVEMGVVVEYLDSMKLEGADRTLCERNILNEVVKISALEADKKAS